MRVGLIVVLCSALFACGEVVKTSPDAPVDADPCATATCECTAATEATDCGAHEVCDESGPGRVCACAPAYADQGGTCVFAGAPLDPGMSDATIWVPTGLGVGVDAAASGNVNPGEVVITRDGVCALSGVTQRFTMPALDRAEPFKLVVTHISNETQGSIPGQLHVQVGAQWLEIPLSRNVYRTDTFCLGAGAYGGEVPFRVTALAACTPNMQMSSLNVDQVEVRVADPGECPDPGMVPNGDMEQATNWTFTMATGTTAGFVAGAGEGGSRAAQINATTRCSEATVNGMLSIATTMPNQALEVFTSGGSGRLQVRLDNKGLATINASSTPKNHRICIPTWAKGTTARLSFQLARSQNITCDAQVRTINIDSVKLVSEPTCPDADLTDPGFERVANLTGPATGWTLTNDVVNAVEAGQVNVINNMNGAHAGNGYVSMTSTNECAQDPYAAATIRVPAPQGAAGPAVKFFGRSPANAFAQAYASVGGSLARLDIAETNTYDPYTLCIPPALVDRPLELRLTMRDQDGSSGCVNPIATQSAQFDDVEVTTDASCPAQ